jgi:hypothetical protein
MANPARIAIERAFKVALVPTSVANPSALRLADPALDTYGLPAGSWYCDFRVGDTVTDPYIIGVLVGISGGQTAACPGLPPLWSVF